MTGQQSGTAATGEAAAGHFRTALGARTLNRDDLQPGQELVLTISSVTFEDVHDVSLPSTEVARREKAGESTTVRKLALGFEGASRLLIVNATNAQTLAKLAGPEVRAWVGAVVVLHRVETKYFGVPGALRLKAPSAEHLRGVAAKRAARGAPPATRTPAPAESSP